MQCETKCKIAMHGYDSKTCGWETFASQILKRFVGTCTLKNYSSEIQKFHAYTVHPIIEKRRTEKTQLSDHRSMFNVVWITIAKKQYPLFLLNFTEEVCTWQLVDAIYWISAPSNRCFSFHEFWGCRRTSLFSFSFSFFPIWTKKMEVKNWSIKRLIKKNVC